MQGTHEGRPYICCTCTLVLGDIPILRENWDDAAIFVTPPNLKGLEESINGLIENSSAREALSQAARERAQRFTPARMADQYLNAYRVACDDSSCNTRTLNLAI